MSTLTIGKFNLSRVIQSASDMVSSARNNQSDASSNKDLPASQQIAEQRTALKKVLGIKGAPQGKY